MSSESHFTHTRTSSSNCLNKVLCLGWELKHARFALIEEGCFQNYEVVPSGKACVACEQGGKGRVLSHSFLARALLGSKLSKSMGRPPGRDFLSAFQCSLSFRHQASEPHAWNCGNPQFTGICTADLGKRLFLEVLELCVGVVCRDGFLAGQVRMNLCSLPPFTASNFLTQLQGDLHCNHPQPPKHMVDSTTKPSL